MIRMRWLARTSAAISPHLWENWSSEVTQVTATELTTSLHEAAWPLVRRQAGCPGTTCMLWGSMPGVDIWHGEQWSVQLLSLHRFSVRNWSCFLDEPRVSPTYALLFWFSSRYHLHFILLGFILPCFPGACAMLITFAISLLRHDIYLNYTLVFMLF